MICLQNVKSHLNRRLGERKFSERFATENYQVEGKDFTKLVMSHPEHSLRTIEFLYVDGQGYLYCIGHTMEFAADFNESVDGMFDYIAAALLGKVVSMARLKRNGKLKFTASANLTGIDIGRYKYTERERAAIADPYNMFDSWRGEVSDEIKLYMVASFVTKMPAVFLPQYQLDEFEKILWEDANHTITNRRVIIQNGSKFQFIPHGAITSTQEVKRGVKLMGEKQACVIKNLESPAQINQIITACRLAMKNYVAQVPTFKPGVGALERVVSKDGKRCVEIFAKKDLFELVTWELTHDDQYHDHYWVVVDVCLSAMYKSLDEARLAATTIVA